MTSHIEYSSTHISTVNRCIYCGHEHRSPYTIVNTTTSNISYPDPNKYYQPTTVSFREKEKRRKGEKE